MSAWMNMQVKRKIFVSFHHGNDKTWFDLFTKTFCDSYEVFYDQSVDQAIRSNDPEYVNRTIREDYIRGSSITIVLCGAETWKRKYVDWEIYSTLYLEHALLGIILPTVSRNHAGAAIVPDRFLENVNSGYAHYINWTTDAGALKAAVEEAIRLSSNKNLIRNSMTKMTRNVT